MGPTYNDQGGIDWGLYAVKPTVEWVRNMPRWHIDFAIDDCTAHFGSPDLLLITEENYRTEIETSGKIPTVLVSYDGWPENYARRDLFKPTIAYTNHPYGIGIHPLKETPVGWRYLPGACAPWIHQDLTMKRDVDFVLYGSMYGDRPAICTQLKAAGFSVLSGWVETNSYIEGLNRALVTLSNCQQEEIKWRFFESIACGCMVMTDVTKLFSQLGYEAHEHYVPLILSETSWPRIEDIRETISLAKTKPSYVRYVTRNAKEVTLEKHTYFHRVETILHDLANH